MIIVDRLLEERARADQPIRVGIIGAGTIGRATARQILTSVPGMTVAAIASRQLASAERAYREAGVPDTRPVTSVSALEAAIARRQPAVTEDGLLLCQAGNIDAILEVTGAIEFGAQAVLTAIEHGKHAIIGAELDNTVGPALRIHADRAGVVLTDVDGDQPGVTMNLYRFLKGVGIRPVLCGNIKGLQDHYRTPTTQRGFAEKYAQSVYQVTSFADGSKISFEQAVVANATGMRVGQRGMFGPTVPPGTSVLEAVNWYPTEALLEGPGIVDYVVGAAPGPGIFILGVLEDESQRRFLDLYKMGPGPLYCFHTPFHLCHLEIHNAIARAVLLGDATIAPLGPPAVDVIATAKSDLRAGDILDRIGGYLTYGQCENADAVAAEGLLPLGVAEGCRLRHDVPRDQVLTYADVELPPGRLCDRLRAEQSRRLTAAAVAAG
jgi:predicted homoserine dehydrogenase-like protein